MPSHNTKARKRAAMAQVTKVQEALRRWDPLRVAPGQLAPADEYDSYAPHIVSMVVQGCTREQLSAHLEAIRLRAMGMEADAGRDWETAGEILRVVAGGAAPRPGSADR